MSRFVFLICVLSLFSCKKEKVQHKPFETYTRVNGVYSATSLSLWLIESDTILKGQATKIPFSSSTYIASDTVRVHVRAKLYMKVIGGGSQVWIGKNDYVGGAYTGAVAYDRTLNHDDDFYRIVDISADNVILYPGDYLDVFLGFYKEEYHIFKDGSAFGEPSSQSYFLVETY